ncbi:imidazole glycerol phosphate synthase subunit HisH [bacterium]|nr:MAG: imidazole glycerol phosphate synthase subunit HisH [bacterium]
MSRITILDYGMGNLRSVQKAIEHVGGEAVVSTSVPSSGRLIIPGVGAFGAAMECLAPLREDIERFVQTGDPLLGICLGQQLLFESSEEFVDGGSAHRGLSLIPGHVRYLHRSEGLKIPHVGWNSVQFRDAEGLGEGLEPGSSCYFVHSLITDCADPAHVLATTVYGETFASAVRRNNVWGAQFHPEKSGEVGLRMLRNFLRC